MFILWRTYLKLYQFHIGTILMSTYKIKNLLET